MRMRVLKDFLRVENETLNFFQNESPSLRVRFVNLHCTLKKVGNIKLKDTSFEGILVKRSFVI